MDGRDPLLDLDMGGKTPRPYQVDTVHQCRDLIAKGKKSIIICKPTGSGKTTTACMLIKLAMQKHRNSVFLAHRRELIKQTSDHLADCNVFHGIILSRHETEQQPDAPVQVASKQTLAARTLRQMRMELPPCDLLILDESHNAVAKENMTLVRKFQQKNPNLVIIGLTATPARGDNKGLGDLFDSIVCPVTYEELRQDGFLVPSRMFCFHVPDMRKVKAQDWDREAAKRVDQQKPVGDLYLNWKTHADGRQTVAFGKTIEHSQHIADEFRKHGVKAEHIDQSTPLDERTQILADLRSGDIQLVSNVAVLTEGWDEPLVSAVILAGPTKSLVQYRQRSGRVLRPCDLIDKTDALVLDHAGALATHGTFPDDDLEWPLNKSEDAYKDFQEKRQKGETKEPEFCEKCKACFYGKQCPNCGSKSTRSMREIATRHGLLKEIKRKDLSQQNTSFDAKCKTWHMCLGVMANRNQSAGSAARMYKSKTGEMPWETGGLPNLPEMHEWKQPVADLFPNYCRRRRADSF